MNPDQELLSSGDEYLDKIRLDVKKRQTGEVSYAERALLLKIWLCTLQQLGADVEEFLAVDDVLSRPIASLLSSEGGPLTGDGAARQVLYSAVDQGYRVLETIYSRLDQSPQHEAQLQSPSQSMRSEGRTGDRSSWPLYQGNANHTGYTNDPGPASGKCAWKFPISLGWKARPTIEGNRIYVASPGMRVALYCLDRETGRVIWKTRPLHEIARDQLYQTPCTAATPLLMGEHVIIREIGSRGNSGCARHLVFINRTSGEIEKKEKACHVDYRAGYAPVAGDGNRLVYPVGQQDIKLTPPAAISLNRLACKDLETGELLWDYVVGPMFGEPVVCEGLAYVGTLDGYLFCLKISGRYPERSSERIEWQFRAGGAVNTRVLVWRDYVYFGANGGVFYCLDKRTGSTVWQHQAETRERRAFRFFSSPFVTDGKVYVGAADRNLYCFDALNGELLWKHRTHDWIRARPACCGKAIIAATVDGTLYAFEENGSKPVVLWKRKIGTHPILSDLCGSAGKVFFNSTDLYLWCVNNDGSVAWRHSLLECVYRNGTRIQTDQIAGGAYYQSKPTAAGDRAFIGTPSGFVYAIEEQTGKELWKFECGAAISAAPSYSDGKIYFGQQGGEEYIYCLDAHNGQPLWQQSVGWVWGSPNIAQGKVFVPGISGYVNCLDAETGSIIWRSRTARSTCTEPVIEGATVYFGGWDGYLYAFDMETGKLRWKFQVGGGCDSGSSIACQGRIFLPAGGRDSFRCLESKTSRVIWEFKRDKTGFNATPAFHADRVFISISRGRGLGGVTVRPSICCLNANDGSLIWEHEGGGLTAPVVANGRVYFGSTASPFLYCVDERGNGDGSTRCYWKFHISNKVEESTPAIYNGKIFILCCDGYLYAVQ